MSEANSAPWYRRTLRWGQTNITEMDPRRYDIEWWRQHWRRTHVQGVIINAGGIVAYYPSAHPLHYQAEFLDGRDLYGDLCAAAREDGLAVLARMDSNRATEAFYHAHPDWFAVDAEGEPFRAGDRYEACINSDYYEVYLTSILREIIERSHPDGFTDNSWSGTRRNQICHCQNCARRFREATNADLPGRADWQDAVYRKWIRWNYDRRIEIWDLNNRVTRQYGGPDCLWLGMISGDPAHESQRFRDMKALCERTEILMLDYQHRPDMGFQANGHAGKLLHDLLGWQTLIPESMPQYQGRQPTFRLSAKPAHEAHLWMVEGFAGTIQPWWHHISAYHEDRRQYRTAEPLMAWHAAHEEYLTQRTPIAPIGLLWSQENYDYYGRDHARDLVGLPHEGWAQALIRARLPYRPIHADHIDAAAAELSLLILPAMGALSDEQNAAIRRFVGRGGALIAGGESSLYDGEGNPRQDFALADLLGVHVHANRLGSLDRAVASWEVYTHHTYLRLHPSQHRGVYGPFAQETTTGEDERHPVLAGFAETDILPFGGQLQEVTPAEGVDVPLSYIPPFPIFPPEFSWMRQEDSGKPALVLRSTESGARIAYLAADLDRCYARDRLPDHGDLLANVVRWALKDSSPLAVDGPGLIDCQLYRQPGRLILHMVNLSGTAHTPVDELLAVGPLTVRLHLFEGLRPQTVQQLVADKTPAFDLDAGWVTFQIDRIEDHEVIVVK